MVNKEARASWEFCILKDFWNF